MTTMTETTNFHWLVGLLEGEGSFMAASPSRPNEPRLEVEMKDYPVMARYAALIGATVITRKRKRFNKTDNRDEVVTIYRVRVAGKRAVRLMRAVQPYLCSRRQQQIVAALASFTPRTEQQAAEVLRPYAFNTFLCAAPMCTNNYKLGAHPFCGDHSTAQQSAPTAIDVAA